MISLPTDMKFSLSTPPEARLITLMNSQSADGEEPDSKAGLRETF
jgi:hypothetical protein